VESLRERFEESFQSDPKDCQEWDGEIQEARGSLKARINAQIRGLHEQPHSPEIAKRKLAVMEKIGHEFVLPGGALNAHFDRLMQGQTAWGAVEGGMLCIDEQSQALRWWGLYGLHDDDDVVVLQLSRHAVEGGAWKWAHLRTTPLAILYMGHKEQDEYLRSTGEACLLSSLNYRQIASIHIRRGQVPGARPQSRGWSLRGLAGLEEEEHTHRVIEVHLHSYVDPAPHLLYVPTDTGLIRLVQMLLCRAVSADVNIPVHWEGSAQGTADEIASTSVTFAPHKIMDNCKTAMARRRVVLDLMTMLQDTLVQDT